MTAYIAVFHLHAVKENAIALHDAIRKSGRVAVFQVKFPVSISEIAVIGMENHEFRNGQCDFRIGKYFPATDFRPDGDINTVPESTGSGGCHTSHIEKHRSALYDHIMDQTAVQYKTAIRFRVREKAIV